MGETAVKGTKTFDTIVLFRENPLFLPKETHFFFYRTMDWKDRLNIVYSTNPDFEYETTAEPEPETKPKKEQRLRVFIEKNHRGGKTVTIVRGFIGSSDDLSALARLLKTKLGVGGSAKEGEVIIQGDFKQRVIDILKGDGYTDVR